MDFKPLTSFMTGKQSQTEAENGGHGRYLEFSFIPLRGYVFPVKLF